MSYKKNFTELPSPSQIQKEYPFQGREIVRQSRQIAEQILAGRDPRLALILGPCSIHDTESALEYARRLKGWMGEIEGQFFPIMRVFIEKPRTQLGWKGMLYDPHLDGSNDMVAGLRRSRALLIEIVQMGIPCAMELLEPIAAPYFEDLITWGLIGARTSASQPHRQMASGLPFPIGFKNGCQGELDTAIAGILASRASHCHLGINAKGHIAAIQTEGNPHSHLVLRGSHRHPNYDPESIAHAEAELKAHRLKPRILVDCSHGNCGKDHRQQQAVFRSVIEQAATNRAIRGLMLESHLFAGKQPLGDDRSLLTYGVSITDPCLSWEETQELLRSKSMSSVQK